MLSTGSYATRPEISGTYGVVASTHWIASAVGMRMLERGANAFDAGVATAFALQVVEPHLNGPGGDVSIIIHDAISKKQVVICGQGPAPERATIEIFRSLGLGLVPGNGLLAACVPGTFDAYMILLRDYGTMRLRDVLEPAIHYASRGFPLIPQICCAIKSVETSFREYWPSSAQLYLPRNSIPSVNELFVNAALANTYKRILDEAEDGGRDRLQEIERARKIWSEGFVAQAIDEFCSANEFMDCTGTAHSGLLSMNDLAKYRARAEVPLLYDYNEFQVLKCGTWTQGLVALQQLAILKGMDIHKLDPTGADFIHILIEATKLAFADRDALYGDPDFTNVPIDVLLSDRYNQDRRSMITSFSASTVEPGMARSCDLQHSATDDPHDFPPTAGTGEPTFSSKLLNNLPDNQGPSVKCGIQGDTVHFDICDRYGNMISATPSGGWLQSSPVIPSLGFPLGTRAQMFLLKEDHPASLQPGKRPRSTLSPSLALRGGVPYLAWGTPGGDQQDQWGMQFFLRHVHTGMNMQDAVDAPAFHSEHPRSSFWPRSSRPGVVVVEDRMPVSTIDELRRRGHMVELGGSWCEGRLTAVAYDGHRLRAAASVRDMQAYAVGR